MLRFVGILLAAVLLITILRSVIGVVLKAAAGLFGSPSQPVSRAKSSAGVPPGGELKRDPVCGTFVPAGNSLRKTIGGEVFHFCSEVCRDKYHGAS